MGKRAFLNAETIKRTFAEYWRGMFPPCQRQRLSFWGYEGWLYLGRIVAVQFLLHWVEPLVRTAGGGASLAGKRLASSFGSLLRSGAECVWAVLGGVVFLAVVWRAFAMRLPVLERIFFVWLATWAAGIECRYWRYDFFVSSDPFYLFQIRTPLVVLAAVGLASFEIAVRRRRRARERR